MDSSIKSSKLSAARSTGDEISCRFDQQKLIHPVLHSMASVSQVSWRLESECFWFHPNGGSANVPGCFGLGFLPLSFKFQI